jgi:pilus assembly protein Flp/PilA
MTRLQAFLSDESGVTAIEYALIASLIAVFVIAAITTVGKSVSTVFTEVGATAGERRRTQPLEATR